MAAQVSKQPYQGILHKSVEMRVFLSLCVCVILGKTRLLAHLLWLNIALI